MDHKIKSTKGAKPVIFVMDGKTDENDKSEDEEKKATEKQSSSLRGFLCQYSEGTSVHGIKNSTDSNRRRSVRFIWLSLLLLAIGSLLSMLISLFNSYHKYPFKTSVTVTPTDQLPFPAVTICNLNSLETGKLKEQDTLISNVSVAVIALSLVTSLFKRRVNDTPSLVENTIRPEILNLTFHDVTHQAFADINTTFVSCFWDDQEEDCHQLFQPVDMSTRRCFQFNGQPHGRRVSRLSGLSSGLQVVFNVRQEDYVYSDILAAGVQVMMHEPGELPDFTDKGFMASPGFSTVCRVDVRQFRYLPEPFKAFGTESCVDYIALPTEIRQRINNMTYTRSLCQRFCLHRRTQMMCGCRISADSFDANPDLPLCTLRDVYTCYLAKSALLERVNNTECPCPRLCQKTEYRERVSVALFPSDVAREVMERLQLIEVGTSSPEILQAGAVKGLMAVAFLAVTSFAACMCIQKILSIQKNYLNLKIFYDDLVRYEVRHVPEYTMDTILGTMGGQMGLFIGASLLSVAEFLELLCVLCLRAARAVCCTLHRHVLPKDRPT